MDDDGGFAVRLMDRGPYKVGLLDEDEDLKRWGKKRFRKARRVGRQAQIMARSISTVLGGGLANLRVT